MIHTASFYAPQDWVGRVYRVSRLHPRGRRVHWETLPFCYPARELLRSYREDRLDFPTFVAEYRRGLDEAYRRLPEFQSWISEAPGIGDFTLLCFEKAGEPCHRVALARWLAERVPSLGLGELR